jgi:hypothetical protein
MYLEWQETCSMALNTLLERWNMPGAGCRLRGSRSIIVTTGSGYVVYTKLGDHVLIQSGLLPTVPLCLLLPLANTSLDLVQFMSNHDFDAEVRNIFPINRVWEVDAHILAFLDVSLFT